MLDRTAVTGTLSAIGPLERAMLHQASLLLSGEKRLAIAAVAASLSGHPYAAEKAGLSERSLEGLVKAFLRDGIGGIIRRAARPDFSKLPMRSDYSEHTVRKLIKKAVGSNEKRRLKIALWAYRGMKPHEISKEIGCSLAAVKKALREFDAFGHVEPHLVEAPKLSGNPDLLRAIANSTEVAFTCKRAEAVAMSIEGADVDDIGWAFNVKNVEVIGWLKLYERIGIESLFPARHAEFSVDASQRTTAPNICEMRTDEDDSTARVALEPYPDPSTPDLEAVVALAQWINPEDTRVESRLIKSYTAKVRLNAISQVARGKSLADVGRQVKARPAVVGEWIQRYLSSGYESLAA
jgi:transposase